MKTKIFSLIISVILISNIGYSQKKGTDYEMPDIPKSKTTGLISYSGVVNQTGSAKELKDKALKWYYSYYKNSHNILKENTENKIVARPRFKILNPKDKKGIQTMAGTIIYTIILKFKDGKYRYEMTNIIKKAQSKYPIEKWLDSNSPKYKKVYAYYLKQVDEHMKKVITDLNKAMKQTAKSSDDDW